MTEKRQTIVVEEGGKRLDKVLAELIAVSRSTIQAMVKNGDVMVNGLQVKMSYQVQAGDEISCCFREPEEITAEPEDIPLDIYYEDQDVIVVNKPSGMVVHPSAGHFSGTLVNALLFHAQSLSGINGKIRPGIVHRIDKDTSGLLMVAKNDDAHASLAAQLKEKTSKRVYVALVHGDIPHQKGTIEAPIGRAKEDRQKMAIVPDGKEARTHFEVIERFGKYTLVACQLETGRTHQIRVHMKYIGHPLVGDPKYGPKNTITGHGQFLHAKELGFTHPKTGETLYFTAPLPDFFAKQLAALQTEN